MKKLKFGIVSIVLLACVFPITKTYSQTTYIDIPNAYFNNTNALTSNRNNVYFNNSGHDGFGVFFLGTGIRGSYEITNNGTTLSCSGQLNGYYSFSFNDFGMLPLDSNTATQHPTEGISIIEGGLFYDCKIGNTTYTGVYGHIKWNSHSNNTHEIWAGINSNNSFQNPSQLKITYSDNNWNTNMALSGKFRDSLGGNSTVTIRFFGDLGITSGGDNKQAIGTLSNPYITLPYETYANAKLYIKGSKTGTATLNIVGYNSSNTQILNTTNTYTLINQQVQHGFVGYTGNINFPNNDNLKSGVIIVTLTSPTNETWSKNIGFRINDPIMSTPIITITQSPNCGTGVIITATGTQEYGVFPAGSLKYVISGNPCSESTNTTNTYINPITVTGETNNNQYMCFKASNSMYTGRSGLQITGIDTSGPTYTLNNVTVEECNTGTLNITNIHQVGCASTGTYPYSRTGGNVYGNGASFNVYSGKKGEIIKTVRVRDSLGNYTEKTGKITWTNTLPSLTTGTLTYSSIISGTKNLYSNLISSMGAKDGSCGSSTISKTGTINCTNGTGEWTNGNGISVTPGNNTTGQVTCTVRFADDEGSTISGKVVYTVDTAAPIITIHQPNASECTLSKQISGSINELGTMHYKTGTDINTVCESVIKPYSPGTNITFNSESDSGTYVCFKATDSYGNISYKTSAVVNMIDRTAPTFKLTGNFEVFECETGTINIYDVKQIGCSAANQTGYKFQKNGGPNVEWITNNTFDIRHTGVVNQEQYTVYVRDLLGNSGANEVTLKRKNREITGNNIFDIGDIVEDFSFDPILEFNLTGWGSCEIIQIQTGSCIGNNADIILSGSHTVGQNPNYEVIIKPHSNLDTNGQCTIIFKDGDTNVTGTILFGIKTKKYYISLDTKQSTSKGHVKLHNTITEFDYSKIKLHLSNSGRVTHPTDVYIPNNNIYYTISNISTSNSSNEWKNSGDININITNINGENLDDLIHGNKCSLFNYEIELDSGFITDPAGNPSNKTIIRTDQLHIFGNYITVAGITGTSYTKVTAKSNWMNNGFELPINTRFELPTGTTKITCVGNENTCPGFSCNQSGIISSPRMIEINGGKTGIMIIDNEPIETTFYYSGTLKIDPLTGNIEPNREQWTGCIIKIKGDDCERGIAINVTLQSFPIKAGPYGQEEYREGNLSGALASGSGDNGFLFFITHPQNLSGGGILGNIGYTIEFTGGEVADEFYYITGSATVNGFREYLNIKRPTFNYANPRSYLFNFPEY